LLKNLLLNIIFFYLYFNTGGDELKSMEQRKGIFQDAFIDLIYKNVLKMTYFTEKVKKRNEAEEFILRFFAYSDSYKSFTDNSQEDFSLNI
jgi:hypothetical protein